MVVTNADNMEYEKSRVYDVDRIVLGYARIYEHHRSHTGLLVPFGISLEAEKWKVTMMGIVTRTSQTIQTGASLPLTPWMAVL